MTRHRHRARRQITMKRADGAALESFVDGTTKHADSSAQSDRLSFWSCEEQPHLWSTTRCVTQARSADARPSLTLGHSTYHRLVLSFVVSRSSLIHERAQGMAKDMRSTKTEAPEIVGCHLLRHFSLSALGVLVRHGIAMRRHGTRLGLTHSWVHVVCCYPPGTGGHRRRL